MFESTKIVYIVLSVILFGSFAGQAQINLNKYKYVVVPKKFEDFKRENQHQANTLVKHLFTKNGFTTIWEDELPADLANNQCKALFVELGTKSSMFSTKTAVVLRDCNRQDVFTSIEGKSKQKDYRKAYAEAIAEAMQSFEGLDYVYEGDDQSTEPVTVSFKNDVKQLSENQKTNASAKKQNEKIVVQEATTENQTYKSREPVASNYRKAKDNEPMVEQIATTEEQVYESTEPVESTIKKAEPQKVNSPQKTNKSNTTVLYAQKISNGYQLVDSTPKILLKILRTSIVDHYIANGDGGSGMVYSKNGQWYFEHYEGENLVVDELNIKF